MGFPKEGDRIQFHDPNTGFDFDLTIEELNPDGEGGIIINKAIFHGISGNLSQVKITKLPEGWTRDDGM